VSGWNVKELEDELVATREHLQAVIEELETSNEEMQALNEEVQAANEELQSSNEELEAANEELQSTNEELTTVNEELQVKSAEVAEIAYDIENVQNCIGFPLFVVNRALEVERFNRPAADLLSLDSTTIGQRITRIKRPRGMGDFSETIRQVIADGKAVETALGSENRHYVLHVTPNFSPSGVRGAIVFMIDNTELHAAEVAARNSQERMMAIMDNSHALSSLKDVSGRYIFVNRRFIDTFGVPADLALGKTDRQLFARSIADEFRRNDLEAMKANAAVEFEERVVTPDGERIFFAVRFPLHDADGVVYAVCTQASDITARKEAENQLRLAARVTATWNAACRTNWPPICPCWRRRRRPGTMPPSAGYWPNERATRTSGGWSGGAPTVQCSTLPARRPGAMRRPGLPQRPASPIRSVRAP
jgi:two-component system CheB/CheR fusion protein